jgi:hypothetical protein
MGALIVQENDNSSDGAPYTTFTVSLTGVTAGNLITVFTKQESGTDCTMTVTDGIGNTLTGLTRQVNTAGTSWGQLHYYIAPSSGNFTYTCTFSPSATATYIAIFVYEVSCAGSWQYDGQATANGNSTAINSGNATAQGPNGFGICGYAEYTGSPVTSHLIGGVAADRVDTVATTATRCWARVFTSGFTGAGSATITPAGTWAACFAVFTESAAAGRTTKNTRSAPLGVEVGMGWRGGL